MRHAGLSVRCQWKTLSLYCEKRSSSRFSISTERKFRPTSCIKPRMGKAGQSRMLTLGYSPSAPSSWRRVALAHTSPRLSRARNVALEPLMSSVYPSAGRCIRVFTLASTAVTRKRRVVSHRISRGMGMSCCAAEPPATNAMRSTPMVRSFIVSIYFIMTIQNVFT